MTRIISGEYGGRRLVAPAGEATRPTSDRVREALFSRLDASGMTDGTTVADLYAGSGALGFEALSRGAARLLLVDHDRRAQQALRANAAALGVTDRTTIRTEPVERTVRGASPVGPVELLLLDPPYAVTNEALLQLQISLRDNGWLAPDALLVIERGRRSGRPEVPDGLTVVDERRYGDTVLWFVS